jgi:hypothetical protein
LQPFSQEIAVELYDNTKKMWALLKKACGAAFSNVDMAWEHQEMFEDVKILEQDSFWWKENLEKGVCQMTKPRTTPSMKSKQWYRWFQ